jgi:acetylglutamate kinase
MLSGHTLFVSDIRGDILNQALPYIQQFQSHTFVVKFGGSAMRSSEATESVIRNVLLLSLVGIRVVLVNGGGPEIDTWLKKLGIEKQTHEGLRVTDDTTMEVVEMALAGRANKSLVGLIQRLGGKAVGLSGRDGNLLVAEAISEQLGRVGNVTKVNDEIVTISLEAGFIPVVCSVATDDLHQPLNVNADTAAAALAAAVSATKLILLSDTAGVLSERTDPKSTISRLTSSEAKSMIAQKRADGGMIPKLEAGIEAIEKGVGSVHLIDGSSPNSLLLEVFTDAGVGTMIVR